jgi:hypothetical protein
VLATDAALQSGSATPATGEVSFSRPPGDAVTGSVPAGWIVKTPSGVRFATDAQVDFVGSDPGPISVGVTAVDAGTAGNVDAGTITVIEGLGLLWDSLLVVVNDDPTTGGGVSVTSTGNASFAVFQWTTGYDGDYQCGEGLVTDAARPVVTIISPLPYNNPAYFIDPADPLVLEVTDADAVLAAATVTLTLDRPPGDAPAGTLPAGTVVTDGAIEFATDEDVEWSSSEGGPKYVEATAVLEGSQGNVEADTLTVWGSEPFDALMTVTNEAAAEGGSGAMGGGLERVIPILIFPDTSPVDTELIHDGDGFYAKFSGSVREAIPGGYRYTVIWYTGAWPSRPKLLPFAYDFTGLEAL